MVTAPGVEVYNLYGDDYTVFTNTHSQTQINNKHTYT